MLKERNHDNNIAAELLLGNAELQIESLRAECQSEGQDLTGQKREQEADVTGGQSGGSFHFLHACENDLIL